MRVIGGELRSRVLAPPPKGVRPTSDRIRESLFMRLGDVEGLAVLDLYAGTGALGIEALSRGAKYAVFVDRANASLRVLKKNIQTLGLGSRSRVMRGDVLRVLPRLAERGDAFDLVFLDPPYDAEVIAPTLAGLRRESLLRPGAVVVVESAKRHALPPIETLGFEIIDERIAGDTRITRLEAARSQDQDHEMADQSEAGTGAERAERRATSKGSITRAPTVALFPASFDPPTNGHLDLIERSRQAFDEVVVATAINVGKTGTFSFDERLEMLRAVTANMDNVRVEGFSGLVVEHAKEIGATVMIRGLRAMSDFEYEFEMALMNRHLAPDLEVMFMMTRQEYLYVSSSRLKELVRFGTAIDEFVPPLVAKKLMEKLGG